MADVDMDKLRATALQVIAKVVEDDKVKCVHA